MKTILLGAAVSLGLIGALEVASISAGDVGLAAQRGFVAFALVAVVGALAVLQVCAWRTLESHVRRRVVALAPLILGALLLLAGAWQSRGAGAWSWRAGLGVGPLGPGPSWVLVTPAGSVVLDAWATILVASTAASVALAVAQRRARGMLIALPALGWGLTAVCPTCMPWLLGAVSLAWPAAAATLMDPYGVGATVIALSATIGAAALLRVPALPPRVGVLAIPGGLAASWWALPDGATSWQSSVHGLYVLFLACGLVALTATLVGCGVFVWRYRGGSLVARPAPPSRRARILAQVVFILAPTILLGALAVQSERVHAEQPRQTADAYSVRVEALQWAWRFTYPDGTQGVNELRVPAGRLVTLHVTSLDVGHSFFVPDLGARVDAQPSQMNMISFTARAPGTYAGACAEFCGIGHPRMEFKVIVS